MAGKLYNLGVPNGSFDAVVVDESGYAWEPEVISATVWPLLTRTSPGLLVLAGDPKQLGPVTFSSVAKEHGLGTSLLERLLEREVFRKNIAAFPDTLGYDSRCITKLVQCYRCHQEIIRVPNALFYDNDLVVPSSDQATELIHWQGLPATGFPLIFHGVNGENVREGSSPSWFNVAEAELVVQYVKRLVETTGFVRADDIGVIAPYQKQVKKVRAALAQSHFDGVTVGSCEQFQGQEKLVIIISTVRTAADFAEYDSRYNLGFVSSAKRMNVAVTRAKALLIVIGSPDILWHDPNWRELIRHCVSNGGYIGQPLPADADGDGEVEEDADMSAAIQLLVDDNDGGGSNRRCVIS
ncbi:mov10b.1 [Symbiodinium microadriaticum]|nr:mov10b.1 [Symbiodinium microadriaticum]